MARMINGNTLEQRIVACLSDNSPGPRHLAALIEETDQAIIDADAAAASEQQRALDPVRSPDPIKAREAAQFAEFAAKRLRNLLPRLQQCYQQLCATERRSRWTAAADQLQVRRDALAEDFAETYPAVVAQLTDLLGRIQALDQEVFRINGAAPNSESRRLAPIDAARLLSTVKLPDLSGQPLWPPPAPPILTHDVMPVLSHPGRNWWEAIEQREGERRAEAQRVAAYYANQTREREDRDNAEARAARGGAP